MDVITIAKRMNHRINGLKSYRKAMVSLAKRKAQTIAEYEKEMALTLIKLKNGVEMELDGHKIVNPPATTSEKIAKGICWEKKLEAEKADCLYKACSVNMNALQAELNGYQSINRYIKEEM